jgi:hypothetical protein
VPDRIATAMMHSAAMLLLECSLYAKRKQ